MKLKELFEMVDFVPETKSEARDYVIHKLSIAGLAVQLYEFSASVHGKEDKIAAKVWRRIEKNKRDHPGDYPGDQGELCNELWKTPIDEAEWDVFPPAANSILVRGGHHNLVASLSKQERKNLLDELYKAVNEYLFMTFL